MTEDPRIGALPDSHGHAKGEHKAFADERPIPYTARMLFLWFYHACRRGAPRFMMVADHINYLTFEDPAAVHVVRRALKLAQAGDLYGAAETAGVELGHASVVSEGLRKGMRYSIGAEMDNDPRSRPDAQNIVDAMKPDGLIRSIHFLPITHPQHGENWMWAFDNPEFKEFYDVVGTERVWELYMETLLDAVEKQPGHIVGHFYVPAKFGHWPDDAVLETYEDRLIEACAARGMAVEINSRYLYKYYAGDDAQLEKYRAVHLRLMAKAKARGVMIAVGSDAHSPRDQGGAFDAVLALLDEADVNEIAFPLGDRLARVALRATEEILRQHSAALAAPQAGRVRSGTPTDPVDEDADDEGTEPRVESPNEGAEIILPPEPEAEPEPEPVAAAPAKAPAKPRKSRAKPKPVVTADAPVAEEPAPEPALEPVAAQAPAPESATSGLISELVAAAKDVVAAVIRPKRPSAKPATPAAAPAPVAAPVDKVDKAAPAPKKAAPSAAPAAKKAPAPKPPAAKAPSAPPKKAAAPKPAPKTAASRKPAAKKPVKAVAAKTSAKKTPAKKAAVKKSPPRKTVATRTPVKKSVAKKTPVKKTVAKKAARKSAPVAKRAVPKRPAQKSAAKKGAKKKSKRR